MTATPDDDIKQACLNEVKLIAEISARMREPDPDGPPLSEKVDALIPVIEAYIKDHDDEPYLLAAVQPARTGLEMAHSVLRGKTADTMSQMFSSEVSPVYIAAAFSIITDLMSSSVGYRAVSALSSVIIAKQKELGDPQLPVEIVVELIAEQSEAVINELLKLLYKTA